MKGLQSLSKAYGDRVIEKTKKNRWSQFSTKITMGKLGLSFEPKISPWWIGQPSKKEAKYEAAIGIHEQYVDRIVLTSSLPYVLQDN